MSMELLINKIKIMIIEKERKASMSKREDYISWDQYFMGLAVLASKRSKDPNTQVGAVIINPKDNRVVSLGYNGFPYGCSDDEYPWSSINMIKDNPDADKINVKYSYVVHAEMNAILSAKGRDLTDCIMYVTYSPCNECMKAIIQSGVKKVIYLNEYKPKSSGFFITSRMAKSAGVEMQKYDSGTKEINLGVL